MTSLFRRFLVFTAVLVGWGVAPAQAQFMPYGGGWGFGLPDPFGGYMQGSASVIQSQGQYAVDMEQARIMREQGRQARIDTRRKTVDNWLYERRVLPTPEDERQRAIQNELRRSRNDPPVSEIWSGKALNDLLGNLKKTSGTSLSAQGPSIPLSQQMLQHINLVGGRTQGNAGIFRDVQNLKWPQALRSKNFQEERETIESLLSSASKQAPSGSVKPELIDQLGDTIDRMSNHLRKEISRMSPTPYMEAKRYIRELESAVKLLSDPNVSNYFDRRWAAQGNTVGELIDFMTNQGLTFAPATRGDEAAYQALYQAMVRYDYTLSSLSKR